VWFNLRDPGRVSPEEVEQCAEKMAKAFLSAMQNGSDESG
jgi:hypothetical protein